MRKNKWWQTSSHLLSRLSRGACSAAWLLAHKACALFPAGASATDTHTSTLWLCVLFAYQYLICQYCRMHASFFKTNSAEQPKIGEKWAKISNQFKNHSAIETSNTATKIVKIPNNGKYYDCSLCVWNWKKIMTPEPKFGLVVPVSKDCEITIAMVLLPPWVKWKI